MTQLIAVDDETASTLRSLYPEHRVVESPQRAAVELVLERGKTMVAVLPSQNQGQSALAVFRWNRVPVPEPPPPLSVNIRAGGFLGLTDEPVFEPEKDAGKKSWWQRFWE